MFEYIKREYNKKRKEGRQHLYSYGRAQFCCPPKAVYEKLTPPSAYAIVGVVCKFQHKEQPYLSNHAHDLDSLLPNLVIERELAESYRTREMLLINIHESHSVRADTGTRIDTIIASPI